MNDIVQVANPLGGGLEVARPSAGGAMASTDQQRAIAEVQAAMVVARANPRNQLQAMDRILNACQRKTLAEQAIYQYARGGTDITGPSIRLAEAIAQNWGNIQFGMREMDQTPGMSAVLAYAWDLETNVRREIVFNVPHVRHTNRGTTILKDPRDIYEMIANNGSRRVRACILAVIPGDIVDAAVAQCDHTMRANADTSPEYLKSMVERFGEYGVSQQQIEARIQRRLEAIQPAQVVSLKKIYQSLRDAMSKPEDWFEPIEGATGAEQSKPASGNAAAKEALKKAAPKKAAKAEPEPAAAHQADGSGAAAQTMGEKLGDEIPKFDGTDGAAADEPTTEVTADFVGPKPDTAERNQTWYSPAEDKLRYAHVTASGVKWYLEPQPDEQAQAAAKPEADIGISLYRVVADKISDAGDLATLSEVQEFFTESKPKLTEEEIKILRDMLAERRNELS